ncbi:MAG TPA: glycosyltransferase [Mucilaginibacter sp.]|nr:glycosyltransferase [Mucilaginibacter sp.]
MKRLLIISPYFPPVNTADMQRARMSLPYYKEFGWDAEVVAVDPGYTDLQQDELLLESVPADIKIHYIKALSKKWTAKLGFGSISYRSYLAYRQKVNRLLKSEKFDLIYFSTTQFQICTLGAYWKKQFNVPYVIDMQDPWHSEYYRDKPRQQRPPKYRFSYRLNKFLEPIAIKQADGLISVSADYIKTLKTRYPQIKHIPESIITFAAPEHDFEIAARNQDKFRQLLDKGFKNIVYIGRGGMDMYKAIAPVFEAVKKGIAEEPETFKKIKLYFIGTSYAPQGQTVPTILPLAFQYGLDANVIEIADRIGYYHTLVTLKHADALFIPGSDDPQYTASKIFPYLLTGKPLLAIFNAGSPALGILDEYDAQHAYSYDATPNIHEKIRSFLEDIVHKKITDPVYNKGAVEKYSARMMTNRQCDLFNLISS